MSGGQVLRKVVSSVRALDSDKSAVARSARSCAPCTDCRNRKLSSVSTGFWHGKRVFECECVRGWPVFLHIIQAFFAFKSCRDVTAGNPPQSHVRHVQFLEPISAHPKRLNV